MGRKVDKAGIGKLKAAIKGMKAVMVLDPWNGIYYEAGTPLGDRAHERTALTRGWAWLNQRGWGSVKKATPEDLREFCLTRKGAAHVEFCIREDERSKVVDEDRQRREEQAQRERFELVELEKLDSSDREVLSINLGAAIREVQAAAERLSTLTVKRMSPLAAFGNLDAVQRVVSAAKGLLWRPAA